MNVLVVCNYYPMPDRQADLFRLDQILRMLRVKHEVSYFAHQAQFQAAHWGAAVVDRYKLELERMGVTIVDKLSAALRTKRYDVVMFEYYLFAAPYLDEVRCWQRQARIVVDTVDLAYRRLLSKARVTGLDQDRAEAAAQKEIELDIYARADMVIAISEDEGRAVSAELPGTPVEAVPLVLTMRPLEAKPERRRRSLVFVGNFGHAANVDAILYFCREVLPAIVARRPDVRLRVVGGDAPATVRALESEQVSILGYVRDLGALYDESDVCIAPLTWGGGLKGKIAEAMAHGLPVVTTPIGADGFGFEPGVHVLIADTAAGFATAVLEVLDSDGQHEALRRNGWNLVWQSYSYEQVKTRVEAVFARLETHPVKSMPLWRVLAMRGGDFLRRHLLWRLKGPKAARSTAGLY